ncbi:MAG: hypothetical protein GWM90_07150, partial [Gemmatimonadetes bacterium]|nr:hypothetical protein [Gemmatimonadota bacterium]NIQ53602.1 hypothetical protein [Gemmatimonadota bacterium]NIU73763.1 hypothetical protein [Gammaproteobacteria bacterium]NIX43891.1 hypothetical protein [Gemmatimonadota bacterium]NIY08109.1 hypothetical protein [Gemmatimonadota bacterium]
MAAASGGSGEDRTLIIPDLPSLGRPLGNLSYAVQESLAGDAPFTIAGLRAFVVGGADRGVDELRAHPVRLAAGLHVGDTDAVSTTRSPLGVERRLRVRGRPLIERLVVPRDLPACFIEWEVEDALDLEIGWSVDLRSGPGRPEP